MWKINIIDYKDDKWVELNQFLNENDIIDFKVLDDEGNYLTIMTRQ